MGSRGLKSSTASEFVLSLASKRFTGNAKQAGSKWPKIMVIQAIFKTFGSLRILSLEPAGFCF